MAIDFGGLLHARTPGSWQTLGSAAFTIALTKITTRM
jgi:hypothetical protein